MGGGAKRKSVKSTRNVALLHGIDNKENLPHPKHIFIYDRLYFCNKFIDLHKELGTKFIVRCKQGGTCFFKAV
jgi:hypothetical protein